MGDSSPSHHSNFFDRIANVGGKTLPPRQNCSTHDFVQERKYKRLALGKSFTCKLAVRKTITRLDESVLIHAVSIAIAR